MFHTSIPVERHINAVCGAIWEAISVLSSPGPDDLWCTRRRNCLFLCETVSLLMLGNKKTLGRVFLFDNL